MIPNREAHEANIMVMAVSCSKKAISIIKRNNCLRIDEVEGPSSLKSLAHILQ